MLSVVSTLSTLITEGLESSELVFGIDGSPVPAAQVAIDGARRFATYARRDIVGMVMTNDRPTLEVVLGAIMSGARVLSLPLPGRGADMEHYAAFVRAAALSHGVTEVVARDDMARFLSSNGIPTRAHSELDGEPLAAPSFAGFGLIQFSWAAIDSPRAISLSDYALGTNVAAILATSQPPPGETCVSWMPLSYDSGLIGMILTTIAAAGPRWAGRGRTVVLEPEQFLRSPSVWIEAMSRWRATTTSGPEFGFRLAMRDAPSDSADLSSLRCAIVGGDVIRADTIDEVITRLAPVGLSELAICPGYGMAEMGLGVTLTPPSEMWRRKTVSAAGLADLCVTDDEVGTPLVASGRPIDGYEVIVDGPPATVASLKIDAPSIGVDTKTGQPFDRRTGFFDGGDLGFVEDGYVYVCGRTDDCMIVNGRKVFVPSIEDAVGQLPEIRAGRVTVVSAPNGEWLVAAEPMTRDGLSAGDRSRITEAVRRAAEQAGNLAPVEVRILGSGTLPMTLHGKCERNEVRRRWLIGTL
jgi:acyl-CoA synthetase (AMP-forming)/AMP-acid ligase II